MKVLKLSSKKIGIALVSFIIVAIGVGVFLFMSSPKIKFMRLVNKEYQSFASILDQAKESELATLSKDNTVTSTGNVSFNLSLDNTTFGDTYDTLISTINDLSLKYEYQSDPKNSNTYILLNSNIGTKDFIDMELYQMSDKKYIYYNGIYDKYIESKSIDFIKPENTQADDTIYLVNKIKDSFISALHTSDFKSESKTIKLNDQSIDTNKITLKLTDKRFKEITKIVLNDFKADTKCLKIIDDLSSEKEDAKTLIDKMITSLDSEKLLTEDLTLDMYVKDNDIVKFEVFSGDSKTIQYLNYVAFNPVKEITFFDNEKILFNAKFETPSKNDVKYEISLGDTEIIANGTISKALTETAADKTWNVNLSFSLGLTVSGSTLGSLGINTKTTTKVGGEVKTIDITNTIKEGDLTKVEQDDISSKLIEKILNALPVTLPETESSTPDSGTYY